MRTKTRSWIGSTRRRRCTDRGGASRVPVPFPFHGNAVQPHRVVQLSADWRGDRASMGSTTVLPFKLGARASERRSGRTPVHYDVLSCCVDCVVLYYGIMREHPEKESAPTGGVVHA